MNERPLHESDASLTTARDRHLFGPGHKRILSLDGGGVRGMLSVGILEHLERTIEEIEGRPVRLGEWFDLIGGTSTGAIIATLLALGYRVAEVRELYERFAPLVFKRYWHLMGWQAKFDARNFKHECERVLGARRLETEDLLTGLCIVLKRLDTGSSWMLINNPHSAFWNDPPDRSFTGNRHLPLANLVRASTAAPHFFDPELIPIVEGQEPAVFIDGGLTPHNNPSLMLAMAALIPAIGLNWKPGADELLIVSVGTGTFRPKLSPHEAVKKSSLMLALKSLSAIISENQNLVLTLMTYFGRSPLPWPINSEIGDLGPVVPLGGKLFRFLRYDARLEQTWLEHELGERFAPDALEHLQKMDNPLNLATLLRVGRGAGQRQVRVEHLKAFETAAVSSPPPPRTPVQDDPGLPP
jgi:predicted acylesterase/phospholipase RssA